MDELSRRLQMELEKRDDTILALEMLVVDQASRLLALESLVLEAMAGRDVSAAAVRQRVAEAAERFRASFERIEGFAERSQRIAAELIGASAGAPSRAKAKAKTKAKAKPIEKSKAKKPARR